MRNILWKKCEKHSQLEHIELIEKRLVLRDEHKFFIETITWTALKQMLQKPLTTDTEKKYYYFDGNLWIQYPIDFITKWNVEAILATESFTFSTLRPVRCVFFDDRKPTQEFQIHTKKIQSIHRKPLNILNDNGFCSSLEFGSSRQF